VSYRVHYLPAANPLPTPPIPPPTITTSEPEAFERRRAVERKHGRIAMMAVVGTIVHNNHIVFDGYISPSNNLKFSDIPTGIAGLFTVPTAGLAQIIAICGLVELAWMPASKYDGDYGVGYFGTNVEDPEEKVRMRMRMDTKETSRYNLLINPTTSFINRPASSTPSSTTAALL
jgi:hypothetical protein